jgi:glycosyltransferase involved in cell wall biosynthesis
MTDGSLNREGEGDPLPFVSVVVPCRNERAYIGACLDSIEASDYPRDRLEVLVVDGMSDDGTRELLRVRPESRTRIRLLDNPGRTAPAALNLGIAEAQGEVIMRMDAHVLYPADYISRLIVWLCRSGADNVGGRVITRPANETPVARAIAIGISHPLGVGNSLFRLRTREPRWVDTVPFGCYRREVFDRIGLFDEELVRNQDDEFNARLIGRGGRILLVPDVTSEYFARSSLLRVWRMYYQYGYFKPLAIRKLGRIPTVRQIVPALFIVLLFLVALTVAIQHPAGLAGGALLALYIGAIAYVGAATVRREGWRTGFYTAGVFPVLHLSYGLGFIAGIRMALSSRRAPIPADAVALSR